jgi:adenylate cyclase, class 2
MYEVEVKLRADHAAVRDRLESMPARLEAVVAQDDTYYDAPHRQFDTTDEALRIRQERPVEPTVAERFDGETAEAAGAVLTYKGPLVDDDTKTREEIETGLEDAENGDGILRALGFEPAALVSKHREVYSCADGDGEIAAEWTVVLDTVSGLGEFAEIELEADETGIDAAREHAYAIARELGLDPEKNVRTSYLELLLDADIDGSLPEDNSQ